MRVFFICLSCFLLIFFSFPTFFIFALSALEQTYHLNLSVLDLILLTTHFVFFLSSN